MAEFVKKLSLQSINKLAVVEALTCILAFSLSFPKGFSAYTLGVWFGVCVLVSLGHWRENVSAAFANRQSWSSFALLLLFFLGLFSIVYASDSGAVTHRLFNARFPVFCIPIGVVLANVRVPIERVLKSYVLGVTCFVLYSFVMVVVMMNNNHFLEAFSGDSWSGLTHLFGDVVNRAYTNTNVVLAIFSAVFLIATRCVERNLYWVYGLALSIMIFFLMVNTSRMVLVSALFVAFVSVLTLAASNKKYFVGGCIIFMALTAVVLLTDNRLSQSFDILVNSLVDGNTSFSDPRFMIWKAGLNIDPHTYLWGYGENNVDEFLFKEYERMGWAEGMAWHYLSHNQYLELYLELGLPGVLAFVGAMVLAPCYAPKPYKKFVFLFVLLFSLIMFTESYISRTAGALFFAFFLSVVCMSAGAEPHLDLPVSYVSLRSKIGSLLVASTVLVALVFVVCYIRKTNETYSLSKGEELLVKGEQYDGYPIYRFDKLSRCSADCGNTSSYYVFFIARNHVQKTHFEIDCYISSDFNGEWAMVHNLDAEHQVKQIAAADITKKGVWQTLAIDLPEGDNFINLNMCKQSVNDLTSLTGFVQFAKPRWSPLN